MPKILLTGTGLFTPPESISNDELVAAFNAWSDQHNADNAQAIAAGDVEPAPRSNSEFIEKASGIKNRYVMNKSGVLDPARMRPELPTRGDNEPSQLCEMAVAAAEQALATAGRSGSEVDAVIVACSNLQRAYPAIAIEVQQQLGARGFGYDMNVACASAAFGVQNAVDALRNGSARCVLVVNPEICTGHLNFRDRDSHFIFGDACTAMLFERAEDANNAAGFEVLGCRLATQFSNNIRNNFGFLNAAETPPREDNDRLFVQEGRRVFKEVVPLVVGLVSDHLADLGITPESVRRFWLHQANLNMNSLIAKRLLGREPSLEEAPIVLDDYANTSSAGSVIAMHLHQDGLESGDVCVLCAFGAGYSAGVVVVKKQ